MTSYWQQQEMFLFCTSSKMTLVPMQLPIQCLSSFYHGFGGRAEGKGLHHCVDHLPLSSAKAKNNWIYIPLLHLYAFRDNFISNFVYILYVSVTPGHFEPTSISISRNTVLSKLVKGVLWVNVWFSIFCVNRITWGKVTKAACCCTFIW
jgi:hypothetical protein